LVCDEDLGALEGYDEWCDELARQEREDVLKDEARREGWPEGRQAHE
jgi:hypothetical protein